MSEKHDLLQLLGRVSAQVLAIVPKGTIEKPKADQHIFAMLVRCMSLFNGIVILLEQDQAEEALILARSLFEDSLRLAQLADADDEREGYMLWWANDSLKRQIGLFREAVRAGLTENTDKSIRQLQEQQDGIRQYTKRNGIHMKKFLSDFDAAVKFDRKQAFWIYRVSDQMVHGSDTAHMFRRRNISDDHIGVHLKCPNLSTIISAGLNSAESLLHAAQATAKIFSWGVGDALDILYRETEVFQD